MDNSFPSPVIEWLFVNDSVDYVIIGYLSYSPRICPEGHVETGWYRIEEVIPMPLHNKQAHGDFLYYRKVNLGIE